MDVRGGIGQAGQTFTTLTALVAERAAGLRLYACQLLPDDPSAADDVVQEALVSLLTVEMPPDDPVPWMYRVIRNAAFDHRRSSARRKRRERRVAEACREWFVPWPAAVVNAEAAERCLARLSAEQREIVVLRIWNGLSFAEIGSIVQRSASTVHGYYADALTQMRAVLEEPCDTRTMTTTTATTPSGVTTTVTKR
jgi:RNA polymerase sigma-70 factor (ECF subfamily)